MTTITRDRVKAFENMEFGRTARATLLQHAAEGRFSVPAYCLMPDHVHYVVTGLSAKSDLRRFVTRWKQATGYAWSRQGRGRLWQEGYWERRSRFDEPLIAMMRYVIENPVRAGLVADPTHYALTGSTEFTVEQISELSTEHGGTKVPPSRRS